MRGNGPAYAAMNETDSEAHYGNWMTYVKSLNESGNWVSGNPLSNDGRVCAGSSETTEGVVGDPDKAVGGFLVIEAESYDGSISLCQECPGLKIGGTLEIRECMEM